MSGIRSQDSVIRFHPIAWNRSCGTAEGEPQALNRRRGTVRGTAGVENHTQVLLFPVRCGIPLSADIWSGMVPTTLTKGYDMFTDYDPERPPSSLEIDFYDFSDNVAALVRKNILTMNQAMVLIRYFRHSSSESRYLARTSGRKIAAELGFSENTVSRIKLQLVDLGFLVSDGTLYNKSTTKFKAMNYYVATYNIACAAGVEKMEPIPSKIYDRSFIFGDWEGRDQENVFDTAEEFDQNLLPDPFA